VMWQMSWFLSLVSTASPSAVSSCYTASEMNVSQFHLTETVHKPKCTATDLSTYYSDCAEVCAVFTVARGKR